LAYRKKDDNIIGFFFFFPMKKYFFLFAFPLLGLAFFAGCSSIDSSPTPSSQKQNQNGKTVETRAGVMEKYSATNLALAHQRGDKVVVAFAATWCPSCQALGKDIMKNISNIPSDVTILEADFDSETALKKKYGITQQHTFVQVDAKNEMTKKWSGSPTLSALVAEVE
jgi:thioredoxin 1